jgi:hypothetical protein
VKTFISTILLAVVSLFGQLADAAIVGGRTIEEVERHTWMVSFTAQIDPICYEK